MARVSAGLLDHVDQCPAHGRRFLVPAGSGRLVGSGHRNLEVVAVRDDAVGGVDGALIGGHQVRDGFVGGGVERGRPVGDMVTEKEVPLDVGQMLEQSQQVGAGGDAGCPDQRFGYPIDLVDDGGAQVTQNPTRTSFSVVPVRGGGVSRRRGGGGTSTSVEQLARTVGGFAEQATRVVGREHHKRQ